MKKILLIMMVLVSVSAVAFAKVADDHFVIGGVSIWADTIFVAGNKNIATLDGIKIGSAKKDIIKTYGKPDVHQHGTGFVSHPDAELVQYFSVSGNMRMTFEVMHGKVIYFDIARFGI